MMCVMKMCVCVVVYACMREWVCRFANAMALGMYMPQVLMRGSGDLH